MSNQMREGKEGLELIALSPSFSILSCNHCLNAKLVQREICKENLRLTSGYLDFPISILMISKIVHKSESLPEYHGSDL